jgi:hypothetical protein
MNSFLAKNAVAKPNFPSTAGPKQKVNACFVLRTYSYEDNARSGSHITVGGEHDIRFTKLSLALTKRKKA